MGFENWLSIRLKETMDSGLYRKVKTMNTAPKPLMEIDGRKQLVFSSNNYLGLANHESCIYAAETVLHQFGVGSSGTAGTTGYTKWHRLLENKIAEFTNSEAALLFADGSQAVYGVIVSLLEKGDVILCDEANHVSIFDGCKVSDAEEIDYLHMNMADLENKLKSAQQYNRRIIVTSGIFSEEGTISPLDKIMVLAKQYDAYVIVDDSHGIGLLGKNGRGTCEYFDVVPNVLIGSLSNAIGAEGGFVSGSKVLIDFLRNQAKTFVYHPSIPPSICAAAYAAFEVIENNQHIRKELFSKTSYVRNRLAEMGFYLRGQLTPIISVIIGDSHQAEAFSSRLEEEGIYAQPTLKHPNISGESSIRLTITAAHSRNDLDLLLNKFEKIGREMKLI